MFAFPRSWTLSTLALASVSALAQAQNPAAQAESAIPRLPRYESAFSGYRPYADEKRASWRDVNDTAAILGGHNAQRREIEKIVTAVGTVLNIDRGAARVRIAGDAVRALGWPAGIAFWPLASLALADQVKPGQRVSFRLEKEGDAYRITAFDHNAPAAPPAAPPVDPHAGHGGRK